MGKWDLLKELDVWGVQPFRRPYWDDDPSTPALRWAPPVNVYEDKEHVYVEAQLPGMNMKDVKLSVTDRTLHLQGEQKEECDEKRGNYHVREAQFGSFARSFRLPNYVNLGEASATYDKGVLAVKVPKLENAKEPKLIPIDVKV